MSSMEFGVRHYAGQVWYSVDGFLDKNRDTLRAVVVELLISSKLSVSVKNLCLFSIFHPYSQLQWTSIRVSYEVIYLLSGAGSFVRKSQT